MQAIQTIVQMVAGEGDEIIIPTPAWPNYGGALRILGFASRRSADGIPQWPLDARSRPAVRRHHAPHQGHLAELAVEPRRLDGDAWTN